jgi:hypothetical protein
LCGFREDLERRCSVLAWCSALILSNDFPLGVEDDIIDGSTKMCVTG